MEPYVEIAIDGSSVTLRAFGTTRFELVEHSAVAMFSVGYDLARIPPTYSRPLVAPGDTMQQLIAGWLNELLLLGAEEGIVWSQCMVDRLEVGGVQGSAAGLYRADVTRTGPVAVAIEDVGPIVEIPDGYWADLRLTTDLGLRLV